MTHIHREAPTPTLVELVVTRNPAHQHDKRWVNTLDLAVNRMVPRLRVINPVA